MSNGSLLTQQRFPAGSVLVPEGGKLNTMFVLREGELEVLRNGVQVTVIREPGTIFGEISVLLDTPHSATVRALTPVEVFVVMDALNVLEEHPYLLLEIARLLARRVSNTTAALVAAGRSAPVEGALVLPREAVDHLGDTGR